MVTPMKLFTISGPMDQFDAVIHQVVDSRAFQPESAMNLMQDIRGVAPFPLKNPYTGLLQQANDLLAQLDLSADCVSYDGITVDTEEAEQEIARIQAAYQQLHEQIESSKGELENIRHLENILTNLRPISARLEHLRTMRFARFRFGHLPKDSYDSIAPTLEEREDIFFIPTRTEGGQVFGVYFTTLQAHDKVDRLFNSLHFVRLMLDEDATGSPEEAIARLNERKNNAYATLEQAQQKLELLREQEGGRLTTLTCRLRRQNDTYDLRRYAAHSHDNFYLTGWVPAAQEAETFARLDSLPQVSAVVDDAAEVPNITPPSKLENNFFARIFEPFVAMFGLPKYGESDPSFFMAATYTLFFGCMFGDLGQGLCLVLVGFILWKKKQNWLGPVISCCGLSASIFGCVYGSVFGFEDILPGFKVMEGGNIMLTLVIALGLGVVMLVVAIGKNILGGLKKRDWKRAIFGANGVAGILFYLSAVLLVANMFMGLNLPLGTPVFYVPCLAFPLLSILLSEPLANLVSGHRPLFHESVGSYLAVGFFELFETALSFLTNTLSFLRVGAYAIIHAGMMHVVFMPLEGGVGIGSILVLIFGNIFVMGFEGLLVGIQVLRLEFYELFGRFYQAGGRPYTGSPI